MTDLAQAIYTPTVDDEKAALDRVGSLQYSEFVRIGKYVRAALRYELAGYDTLLGQSTANYKVMFATKLAVFLVLVLLQATIGWTILMSQFNRMVDIMKGIVLIVSFRRIEKIDIMKD